MTAKFSISLPDELCAALDNVRGDVSRSLFVRRCIERAISETQPITRMSTEMTITEPEPPTRGRSKATSSEPKRSRSRVPDSPPETDLPKIAKRHWA